MSKSNRAKVENFSSNLEGLKVRVFLMLIKMAIKANSAKYDMTEKKINYTLRHMQKGTAVQWMISKVTEAETTRSYRTWENFITDFTKAFISDNKEKDAKRKLFHIKQEGKMVIKYNNQFRDLATRAKITDFATLSEIYT